MPDLIGGFPAEQRIGDHFVDVSDGFQNAFAEITALVAIAQFQRFALAGGGAARYRGAAHDAAFQVNFDFNGWIAARIKNFTGINVDDLTHDFCPLTFEEWLWFLCKPRAVD